MSTPAAPHNPPLTRDESGTLLGQTMGLVAATAGLFALGAYLGRDVSYGWGWVFFIAAFAVLLGDRRWLCTVHPDERHVPLDRWGQRLFSDAKALRVSTSDRAAIPT